MISQVSIFVDNRPGSLWEVTQILGEEGINIRAVAAYDTPEFGILRMVVDQVASAKDVLTRRGFVVRITEVVGAELVDEKGSLGRMLEALAKGGVNVNYIYSFVIRGGKAPVMVFHTDDNEKACAILGEAKIRVVEAGEL
ncbi:MAG: ACT domain-containing protein [Lachnospiraceae bacterium]|nr:ACT domain-containing protein [Lachnospiraceae bacterium]